MVVLITLGYFLLANIASLCHADAERSNPIVNLYQTTGLEKTHRVTSSQQVAKQLLLLRLAKRMMTCKIELQIRLAHICNISTFDEN